jgi:hypothetical protein
MIGKSCFSFTEAVNLDTISFGDDCEPPQDRVGVVK